MRFRILIQPPAAKEIRSACGWIARQSPRGAVRWYNGLVEVIESLRELPARCPTAPENDAFDEDIRQLLYRCSGSVYRILFTIAEDEVHILHVRHGARPPLAEEAES